MARSQKPLSPSQAFNLLRARCRKFKVLGVLGKSEAQQVKDAVDILMSSQNSYKRKKYKLFLHDILDIGPHLVLISAVSLGQGRVTSMNKLGRKQLLIEIESHKQEFDTPSLRSLASDYGVPRFSKDLTSFQLPVPSQQQQDRDRDGHEANEVQGQGIAGSAPWDILRASTIQSGTGGFGEEPEQIQTMGNGRQIDFLFSKGPVSDISRLKEYIDGAIQSSHLWRTEREVGDPTTNCLTTMIPRDKNADISITMWIGQKAGMELVNILRLQPTWSSSLGHLSL